MSATVNVALHCLRVTLGEVPVVVEPATQVRSMTEPSTRSQGIANLQQVDPNHKGLEAVAAESSS